MNEMICALDVGTTKICALIAVPNDATQEGASPGDLRVIGVGRVAAHGLRRGVVVNPSEVTAAIGLAIDQAEKMAGDVTMEKALVGISGAHVTSTGSKGTVPVGRNGRRITQEDCQKALEQARSIALPHNREIINAVPRCYTVDDQEGVLSPVGMFAYRLEVDASIITGATTAVTNLVNCVQDNGVEVKDLVLEPLASAEAVLTADERQLGVALVDIGGGTTDMAIYLESAPWHTHVWDVGGDHFVRDVAAGLRMPYDKAETLIKQFGHALPERVPSDAEVRSSAFGQEGFQIVHRRALAEIINARAEEVTDLIIDEIKRSGYDGLLPAGIVLTGGVAQLNGLSELSKGRLAWPVRIGHPNGIGGSVADLSTPDYATAVGLLLLGTRQGSEPRTITPPSSPLFERIVKWLRSLLPFPTP